MTSVVRTEEMTQWLGALSFYPRLQLSIECALPLCAGAVVDFPDSTVIANLVKELYTSGKISSLLFFCYLPGYSCCWVAQKCLHVSIALLDFGSSRSFQSFYWFWLLSNIRHVFWLLSVKHVCSSNLQYTPLRHLNARIIFCLLILWSQCWCNWSKVDGCNLDCRQACGFCLPWSWDLQNCQGPEWRANRQGQGLFLRFQSRPVKILLTCPTSSSQSTCECRNVEHFVWGWAKWLTLIFCSKLCVSKNAESLPNTHPHFIHAWSTEDL